MTKIDDNAGRIGEFGVDNTLRSDESLLTLISRGSLGAPGSPTIKNKQKRTRESADLMNMLLYELYSNRDLKSFKNPFNVCGRTKKSTSHTHSHSISWGLTASIGTNKEVPMKLKSRSRAFPTDSSQNAIQP